MIRLNPAGVIERSCHPVPGLGIAYVSRELLYVPVIFVMAYRGIFALPIVASRMFEPVIVALAIFPPVIAPSCIFEPVKVESAIFAPVIVPYCMFEPVIVALAIFAPVIVPPAIFAFWIAPSAI